MRGQSADVIENQNISILDIFGFENFKVNGFDQMCINLANERLHYFFNQHIFAAEMGSYAAEGIEMNNDVMFHDNQVILDLFFKKPMGLLALLDEECNFPKASAKSLLSKFNKNLKENELFKEIRGDYAFGVEHYAGSIQYHTDGFLEKNTDPLPELIPPCFETSRSSLLKMMYSSNWNLSDAIADPARNRRRSSKGTRKRKTFKAQKSRKTIKRGERTQQLSTQKGKPTMARDGKKKDKEASTVSAHFRVSLDSLMQKMGLCDPHFVRCIKPNAAKVPRQWEQALVLRQLTYTGMLQTVKMRREGFPFRIEFGLFFDTYHGIIFDFLCPMKGNAQTCTELLERLEEKVEARRQELGQTTITTKLSGWKVAKSMVFLKYWQADLLDGMVYPFGISALTIQTQWRMYIARKRFQPMKQKYADECAQAATFVTAIGNQSERVSNSLETLIEEEVLPCGLNAEIIQ